MFTELDRTLGRTGTISVGQRDAILKEVIKELCKMVGTQQAFTMRASKQENGIVERSIKEIRRHLRAIIFHTNLMDNWSTYIPLVQRIFSSDVKESFGVSPARILFGKSIHLDRGIFLHQVPN